jgi:hypothetical protein
VRKQDEVQLINEEALDWSENVQVSEAGFFKERGLRIPIHKL